jgi:hypothetical protein
LSNRISERASFLIEKIASMALFSGRVLVDTRAITTKKGSFLEPLAMDYFRHSRNLSWE